MDLRSEVRDTLRLAFPIAAAQLLLMTMGLVDVALVGRVSDVELAAVSIGNAIVFTALCPAMGITMAVEPLASQATGAGDEARAWSSLLAGILVCLLASIPTALVAYIGCRVLAPLGVDPAVIPLAERFVLVRLPGLPAWLLFLTGKAFLEARGFTRPLWISGWLANLSNALVGALLVFGDPGLLRIALPPLGIPPLGSLGAGIATGVSSLFLAAITLAAVWENRPSEAHRREGRRNVRQMIHKLLVVGGPIGFQVLTEAGVFCLASVLVARLGASVSAAHQIAIGLAGFTFMGAVGVGAATAVRVGRAVGAGLQGQPRLVGLIGVSLGFLYEITCASSFWIFGEPLARWFSSDPVVVELAAKLLRVAALFQLADGIQAVSGGALRGAADTTFASWANLVCHWGIGLPLALLFGFHWGFGAPGVWWGLSAGLSAVAIVLFVRFLHVSARPIAAI